MGEEPVEGEPLVFSPAFMSDDGKKDVLLECAANLRDRKRDRGEDFVHEIPLVREECFSEVEHLIGQDCRDVRAAVSVLVDLVAQGWELEVRAGSVAICRPWKKDDREAEKERIRRALVVARDEQLREESVRDFVRSMEARRVGPEGWTSIFSLFRSGPELAARLEGIADLPKASRALPLREAVQPYVQIASGDEVCKWTGLRLLDIWRYLRYTWLTPAKSTPGRSMKILVRDAAVEPHPVMGIAELSSVVIRQRERDHWIGWEPDCVMAKLREPSSKDADWLHRSLDTAVNEILVDDLLERGLITKDDLDRPRETQIRKLREWGEEQAAKHQMVSGSLDTRAMQANGEWRRIAETHLYRSKRAKALAKLLNIRRVFQKNGFGENSSAVLSSALGEKEFRKAVGRLVRHVKATHVGINMMELSVCGAVAPYNPLIVGKLVGLLMASSEIRNALRDRYRGSASVIASGMKGEEVVRAPEVVLLTTTGLFGGGSSQYNRLRMPVDAEVDGRDGEIRFHHLEGETSYSTYHFSDATVQELTTFMNQWHGGTGVHSIFGEGVNPRMRKIREALHHLGFPHDELLQTASPRSIYVIPLAHNFREVLLGQSSVPDYILPPKHSRASVRGIAEFWIERWLAGRIAREGVLESVRQHELTHPITHGARVPLPACVDDSEQLSFEEMIEEPWSQ